MMKIISIFGCLGALILFCVWGCKTKKYLPDNYPKNQISFGSGGGFTGKEQQYILLENGQMFKFNGITKDTTEMPAFTKKEAKAIFKEWEASKLAELEFQQPGNMYFWINSQTKDTTHQRIVWGVGNQTEPEKAKALYSKLMEKVREKAEQAKEAEDAKEEEPISDPNQSNDQ